MQGLNIMENSLWVCDYCHEEPCVCRKPKFNNNEDYRQRILNNFREFTNRMACVTATENIIMNEALLLWGQLAMSEHENRLLKDRIASLEARVLAISDPHVQLTST
jgi:hypothetical protein